VANLTAVDSFDAVYKVVSTDKVTDGVFNTVIQALLNRTQFVRNRLPVGMIAMWSGAVNTIPAHWALCDGTNGTPDLRGGFVVGAGGDYAVTARGGSADAVVVAHGHEVVDPGHEHKLPTDVSGELDRYTVTYENTDRSDEGYGTNLITSSEQTGITVKNSGENGANKNLPPYYALCYIKLIG
jgi:hypothetical protein